MTRPSVLVDANLSHALTVAMQRAGIDAVHIATWEAGRYRQADDEILLLAALAAGRVLVTLDAATIPACAWAWSAADPPREHAGVLVISARISQSDVGGQLASVHGALKRMAEQFWAGLVVHAYRATS